MNQSRFNPTRTTSVILIAILALSVFGGAGNSALAASPGAGAGEVAAHGRLHGGHPDNLLPPKFMKQLAFHDAMRVLWEDHMQWTYATVDAFFHNPSGLEPHLARLLQNQKDIGAAIIPFYGQEAGDKLAALLTTHIQQAVPVLKAAQAGDQTALDKALADWYANAKEIADFLSAANPKNWTPSVTESTMKMHIDQTTTYAVDLLKGDYAAAIKHYDEARHHMMELADVLSTGIISQFPKEFK